MYIIIQNFSTITIDKDDTGTIRVKAFVTDFTDSMGYCEYKIPFFKEGISIKTAEMIVGTEHHEEAERMERDTAVTVPLTKTKLENKKDDLNFMREDIRTTFMHEFDFPSGKAKLVLFGRADKVFRQNETLIISDDKHTAKPERYHTKTGPYDGQLLQVLTYLHSKYDLGSSFGDMSEIPHAKKMYKINIVDSRTKSIYKTYEDYITKKHTELFFNYISRFTKKCLQLDDLKHHNSKPKCKACGYFNDCTNALR